MAVSYRKLWDRRSKHFIEEAIRQSGMYEDDFYARLEEADAFADVFQQATIQATENGDPEVSDFLAKLVSAALEPTKIDTTSYLLTRLAKLETIHIRILARFKVTTAASFDAASVTASGSTPRSALSDEMKSRAALEWWDLEIAPEIDRQLAAQRICIYQDLQMAMQADDFILQAALTELQAAGMLSQITNDLTVSLRLPEVTQDGTIRFLVPTVSSGPAWRLAGIGESLRTLIETVASSE